MNHGMVWVQQRQTVSYKDIHLYRMCRYEEVMEITFSYVLIWAGGVGGTHKEHGV